MGRHARRHPQRRACSWPRTRRASSAWRASKLPSAAARTSSSSTSGRAHAGRASRRRCCANARGMRASRAPTFVSLDVVTSNEEARVVWRAARLRGAREARSPTPLDALEQRLENARRRRVASRRPTSRATTRSRSSARSRSSCRGSKRRRSATRTAGSASPIPVFDRDREAHGRFVKELSDRLGAVTIALGARRRGRSLPALRARPDGRRVPLGADVLRPALEGRRARARREPDARLAADGRRPRRRAPRRAHRGYAGRAAAGPRALRADRAG